MEFLRRHVFFITCGAAAAAGIFLGAMGLKGMPKVGEEMKKVESIYARLNTLQSKAVNLDRIEAEKRRIKLFMEDRNKVFTKAKEIYGYEPLVEGVFPDGNALKRIEFRRQYAEAMEDLFGSLKAGSPATPVEIAAWRDKIENERAAQREYGLDRDVSTPPPPPSGPTETLAGVLTRAGARENAEARANMAVAQRSYCYAMHFSDGGSPSLEFEPKLEDTGTADAPYSEDVWRAQLGYWIQKDVVDAIVAINNEAAEAVRKKGEDVWVGIMPVKEVISIRVSPDPDYVYVPLDGDDIPGSPPGGYEAADPPGTPETVWTHSGSNDWYEVVQFSVKLIMDQRDIPLLIDRLCKDSFHTLLRVSYEAVPPNKKMVGKIYGSEPTVNVVMDFETIMLGEVFRPLMPDEVCDYYEIRCPEREETEG